MQTFNWRAYSFFRWLLPLISGILVAHFFAINIHIITLIFFTVLFVVLYLQQQRGKFTLRKIIGALLAITFFLIGYQRTWQVNELNDPQHFSYKTQKRDWLIGTIQDMPFKKGEKLKVKLSIFAMKTDASSLIPTTGNLLVYLENNELSEPLTYGDVISLKSDILKIPTPKNPKSFNYQQYLHHQNIHYQAFPKKEDWHFLHQNKGNVFFKEAYRLRAKFIQVLRRYLTDPQVFSVGSALVLGYKNEIAEEVRTAYANTGAMHVLAVSGLHVGLIFWILNVILKVVRINKLWWQITKSILLIFSIWVYAFLTGASPSVLRAATMFSFLIIGLALKHHQDIYHSLVISAFLLLLYQPNLMMSVGFQLSYAAVLGIVFFQPIIANTWVIKNKIGDYCWQLVCVSLAAQLTTLPLSLFYFHQFPIFFWLSGLIVVPAAFIILSGGIILFFLEGILEGLGHGLGNALNLFIKGINTCIFKIAELPGSLVMGISFGLITVILLYLIILGIVGVIKTKKYNWNLGSLGFLFVISFNYAFTQIDNAQNRKITIYHTYKHTLIDFFTGNKSYVLKDSTLSKKSIDFATQNYRWSNSIKETKALSFNDLEQQFDQLLLDNRLYERQGMNCIQFCEYKMVILSQKIDLPIPDKKLSVDLLLLRNSPSIDLVYLLERFNFKQLVWDASNTGIQVKKWRKQASHMNIDYWDIPEQGAFSQNVIKKH